jgi:uncharacterized protein (TIGR03067 family)
MKQCLLAALLAVLLFGNGWAQDTPENDRDRIQGTWVRSWAVYDGKDLLDEGIQATFKGDRMTLILGKDKKQEWTFKLDPNRKPKEITLRADGKELKGIYRLGGYRLGGEYLQMCFGAPGGERPKVLWYKKGSKTLFLWLDPEGKKRR